LLAAARRLDDAIRQAAAVPEGVDAAIADWNACQDALAERLLSAIVANLPIDELRRQAMAAGWSAADGLRDRSQCHRWQRR
jgi:hypothetical protein